MFERLTHRSKYGIAYTKIAVNESNMVDVGECYTGRIIDRLAAYEDTGLTPAQVEAMKMDMEQLRADNINAEMNLAHMTADKDEQAGRIMELEEALKCLHDLLEEHGPLWYLRKHHNKAIDALLGGKEDANS